MQTRWPLLLAGGGVRHWSGCSTAGTPGSGVQLTRWVPLGWGNPRLSGDCCSARTTASLKPNKLPAEQRASSTHALRPWPNKPPRRPATPVTTATQAGVPLWHANAFALPGGTVVMTDAIVRAAADKGISDDALIGVLAHEIGHVVHRHGMRMVVEQGVLNMGLGLALGDVSGVVSTGATLLTSRAYSRFHERGPTATPSPSCATHRYPRAHGPVAAGDCAR